MLRLTVSLPFHCMPTFLISGRPTRSSRTGRRPTARVSATTASNDEPPSHRWWSISRTRPNTFAPSMVLVVCLPNAILPVVRVSMIDSIWKMNGSDASPANRRSPSPLPPPRSFTVAATVLPAGVVHVHSCASVSCTDASSTGTEKVQSKVSSSPTGPTANRACGPVAAILAGRSRNRHTTASENCAPAPARGKTVITNTSRPGRSGLGNAKKSQMSEAGSARARGDER